MGWEKAECSAQVPRTMTGRLLVCPALQKSKLFVYKLWLCCQACVHLIFIEVSPCQHFTWLPLGVHISVFDGKRVSFGKMKKFWRPMAVMAAQQCACA